MTRTRRQFLLGAAAVGAAVVGLSSSGSADAHWLPDHVTVAGDGGEELEKYAPSLITLPGQRQKMQGLYGIWMDSTEHDLRAYMYWLRYSHQDSLLDGIPLVGELFSRDAHLGDHEPFIAFVDVATGEVRETVYTGYHHYGVHLTGDQINLAERAVDNRETHVVLRVIDPHHHYRLGDPGRGALASNLTSLNSFLEAYPRWDDRGIWDSSDRETVTDPWRARERGHWWRDGSIDKRLADIRLFLNWRDAGDRDTLIRD
ncbi:hypothetical protein ACLI4U_18975 (plasmid) [Natrialbaceae archaeon A-CW2]